MSHPIYLLEVMAINESSRLRSSLRKENVPVKRLVVNQVLPPSASDCKFCAVKRKVPYVYLIKFYIYILRKLNYIHRHAATLILYCFPFNDVRKFSIEASHMEVLLLSEYYLAGLV